MHELMPCIVQPGLAVIWHAVYSSGVSMYLRLRCCTSCPYSGLAGGSGTLQGLEKHSNLT